MDAGITKELNALLCTFPDYHSHLRRKLHSFRIKGRPQRDGLFGYRQTRAITSSLTYKQTPARCETGTFGKKQLIL